MACPMGMKVDARGDVLICAAGGVLIVSPEGKHLGSIITGQQTGNCAWGMTDRRCIFARICLVTRIKMLTKGAGW